MNLTDVSIRRPVMAWMLMLGVVLFGAVAAWRIGVSQYPDVDFPTISIQVTWEGAAPEVIEHDVVETLEEAVTQVEGVRSITSSSRQGSASITVELDLARDVDLALQDVQTKVSQAQQRLPRDLDPPVISKTNPEDQPIMWIGLSGPYSTQLLADTARYTVKEKLQLVPGVGEITMGGYVDRNVRIWIDATKLDDRRVTVSEVMNALRREHVELPAGRLEARGREINVRVLGEAIDLATLRRIVIRESGGAPVYLEDVALVEDGFEDVRRMSRVGGQPAQGMGVRKQRGANAVAVAAGIRQALKDIQARLPEGMEVGINFDSTVFIEESVNDIKFELLLSILLTGLVCWLFLGSLSSTLNVILAIPMSLLGTVAVIYFLGFTLNTFTLLALALSVGIVVDDAIMVLENIYRHAEMGKSREQAARDGTKEITFAALAATIAVVAIFLPVVFMKGVIGRFFLQFGITLSVAVMFSYLEAITLAPARLAQMSTAHHQRGPIGRKVDEAFSGLSRGYAWLLEHTLRWPALVLLGACGLFYGACVTFQSMPKEFVPSQDQSRLLVRMQTAVGADLGETDRLFKRAEAFVQTRKEIKRVFAVVGGMGGTGVNTGILFLTLKDKHDRKLSAAELTAILRKEFNSYPGLRANIMDLSQSGFTAQRGFPVEFSLRGSDWPELTRLSDEVQDELRASGLVVDLDTDYQLGMPELRVLPDRARAADLGVSIEDVATTLNALVGGLKVGKYSSGGRRVDVRLRLLASQRRSVEDLTRLKVRTRAGDLVPLASLIQTDEQPALQSITRRERQRAITIFAGVAPGHSQEEALALVAKLGKKLPPGYTAVLGGASAAAKESTAGLLFAFLLGIGVAYMILAAQFNSIMHPITVLTILPLSVAGAIFALKLGSQSINLFSLIGLLLLMGIVKKNSILLVDYAVHARKERGLNAREAMQVAGPVRLRPILMTSIAMMMAVVPSVLGIGSGGEIRRPMAIGVLGGLVLSTLLSLLVVPAFYVCADWLGVRLRRLWRWIRPLRPIGAVLDQPAPPPSEQQPKAS